MLLSAQIQKRCDLACLLLGVLFVSACLYLDDEMTLLYFPSFPLLPLLYCTSSTVDSSPSLVYCAAVLCILIVIATRNATSTRRHGAQATYKKKRTMRIVSGNANGSEGGHTRRRGR